MGGGGQVSFYTKNGGGDLATKSTLLRRNGYAGQAKGLDADCASFAVFFRHGLTLFFKNKNKTSCFFVCFVVKKILPLKLIRREFGGLGGKLKIKKEKTLAIPGCPLLDGGFISGVHRATVSEMG